MNVFLRLMHEGLTTAGAEDKRIDVAKELMRGPRTIPAIATRLETAFPVSAERLRGSVTDVACSADDTRAIEARFLAITAAALVDVEVSWELDAPRGTLLGTVHLPARRQPFALRLQSLGSRLLIRCVSPVGRVGPENTQLEEETRHDR